MKSERVVVQFSGGKDSTWMLFELLRRGFTVEAILFFDWGMEFPEMEPHIRAVEASLPAGLAITTLRPEKPWLYWFKDHPVRSRWERPELGIKKGEVHRFGHGWPSPSRRWCTRIKCDALDRHVARHHAGVPVCIGFAADEAHRAESRNMRARAEAGRVRFPLIEWGVTEGEALDGCRRMGFDWGGVYDVFRRVSCFCCPLGGVGKARLLREHRPDLWRLVLDLDEMAGPHNQGFDHYKSAHDLDRRFAAEDRQGVLTT